MSNLLDQHLHEHLHGHLHERGIDQLRDHMATIDARNAQQIERLLDSCRLLLDECAAFGRHRHPPAVDLAALRPVVAELQGRLTSLEWLVGHARREGEARAAPG